MQVNLTLSFKDRIFEFLVSYTQHFSVMSAEAGVLHLML